MPKRGCSREVAQEGVFQSGRGCSNPVCRKSGLSLLNLPPNLEICFEASKNGKKTSRFYDEIKGGVTVRKFPVATALIILPISLAPVWNSLLDDSAVRTKLIVERGWGRELPIVLLPIQYTIIKENY